MACVSYVSLVTSPVRDGVLMTFVLGPVVNCALHVYIHALGDVNIINVQRDVENLATETDVTKPAESF
jgi:hypothetical protein